MARLAPKEIQASASHVDHPVSKSDLPSGTRLAGRGSEVVLAASHSMCVVMYGRPPLGKKQMRRWRMVWSDHVSGLFARSGSTAGPEGLREPDSWHCGVLIAR
jgi:hypothetical protein